MKCELCHQKDAETAIQVGKDGVEEELYVCQECARKERVRRQKKSQRTRKMTGLPPGMSISVTGVAAADYRGDHERRQRHGLGHGEGGGRTAP